MTATVRIGDDRAALARALVLAEAVRATTSPNPPVGCVLVRDGVVVGEGATTPPGGPHAEVVALRAAGAAAEGASAYVTLEPCAHHGRTPPCTDALLAAGVARVVYAVTDPDPVAAGGAEVLRAAGVAVSGPQDGLGAVLPGAVARQLEGFLHRVHTGRPHLTLKLAQTADGLLAADGRRWVTGPIARRAVHRWRAAVDAVLVGSGTVLADDPRLDVRDAPTIRQPRPVVLDARLRTPPDAAVARSGAVVVTAPGAPAAARSALSGRGVEVVEVPAGHDGGVELRAALRALSTRGITSVLAEPGATLAGALVAAGLVDRLVLHVAAGTGDGPPRRAVGAPPGRRWSTERAGGAGPDVILHLVPAEEQLDGHGQEAA